jgi:hypothetical protein
MFIANKIVLIKKILVTIDEFIPLEKETGGISIQQKPFLFH